MLEDPSSDCSKHFEKSSTAFDITLLDTLQRFTDAVLNIVQKVNNYALKHYVISQSTIAEDLLRPFTYYPLPITLSLYNDVCKRKSKIMHFH